MFTQVYNLSIHFCWTYVVPLWTYMIWLKVWPDSEHFNIEPSFRFLGLKARNENEESRDWPELVKFKPGLTRLGWDRDRKKNYLVCDASFRCIFVSLQLSIDRKKMCEKNNWHRIKKENNYFGTLVISFKAIIRFRSVFVNQIILWPLCAFDLHLQFLSSCLNLTHCPK
jgi:hypothetical protein